MDDFFTREFRDHPVPIRPVASPNDDYIVANACESAPFQISAAVKKRDFFWIKKQRYSLDFMLNMSDLAKQFHGGTVYQAFLSATSYHRWHSPVSGTIYKTELVDGSYYSQTHNIQDDPASPNMSQGYLAQVAARGIVYIEADNPDIGLMCFVSIGMSEVSSNEITVKEKDKVKKGGPARYFVTGRRKNCRYNGLQKIKVKSKEKLELIFALHPPAEDEETAMEVNFQSTDYSWSAKDKDLHPPCTG
ncbi:hypothetical protein OS493_038668 [Desmophyllum pertusum]|uniref:Phosphatidylserine decarboxylase n=1 Tax=Desmophyllum pertusum TaxID=174260 RepID=A0A9W9ZYG4_9CNID|nr:hypothetical protein OS493_038668 [Desmophyllum pertusum]